MGVIDLHDSALQVRAFLIWRLRYETTQSASSCLGLRPAACFSPCPSGIPQQANSLHRASRCRWWQRHGGAHSHRALGCIAQTVLHCRQPSRWWGCHCLPSSGACCARWLHFASRLCGHPWHQPRHPQSTLRPYQGPHAYRHDWRHPQRVGGQRLAACAQPPRICGVRESQSRTFELWLSRSRLLDALDHGVVQTTNQFFHGAHSLPGCGIGLYRPDWWPDSGHVPRLGRSRASHEVGPRACTGGDRPQSPSSVQRHSDA